MNPIRKTVGPGRFRAILWALILGVLAGAGSAWAGATVAVGSGVSVSFTQLNVQSDDPAAPPVAPNSEIGVATFTFDSSAGTQLVGSGAGAYFNVYTSTDGINFSWQVQNLFIQFVSSSDLTTLAPTVQFGLGVPNGTPLSSITFQISETTDPVSAGSPPPPPPPSPTTTTTTKALAIDSTGTVQKAVLPLPGQPVYTTTVTPVDYHTGGYNGGGTGALGQPAFQAWGNGARPAGRPVAAAWVGGNINTLPAVSEDWMGCAPAGVARSIRYMLNNAGAGGPTAQQIYAGLYGAMGTGRGGTQPNNMVTGKGNWAAANGYGITTGWVNVGQAMNIIANGGDVEIALIWNGGGHVAMIVQIQQNADGSYQIWYIDDPVQGDGRPGNQLHVITVLPNGIVAGTNGQVGVGGLLGETMP